MIEIVESASVEDLADLRRRYLASLVAPGARRAIANAGFVSRQRILEIGF